MAIAIAGSVVLVTGGTGSFGSTMVHHLLDSGADEVRVFSQDELKQHEMRGRINDARVRFIIGDVRDAASVDQAMRGVNLVFHAAALKQVPSCEFFPMQAVQTNILGSSNVIEAAHRNGVSSVVCLGTDKAVQPVNAMGMTKALMEKTAQAFVRSNPSSETRISTVRYGNVMCSRGSVIPLFVDQARQDKPLTITDPEMTRFLMSLDEAVELVDHAFTMARPGDLFVRKAPACTLETLAKAVARALGVPERIQIIGTRHGEKLYETLATREELHRSDDQGDYYRIGLDARDLNYEAYFDEGDRTDRASAEDYHSHNTRRLGVDEVVQLLESLPQFREMSRAR